MSDTLHKYWKDHYKELQSNPKVRENQYPGIVHEFDHLIFNDKCSPYMNSVDFSWFLDQFDDKNPLIAEYMIFGYILLYARIRRTLETKQDLRDNNHNISIIVREKHLYKIWTW